MKQARLFLFHGNNSQASRRAVRKWEELFQQKYGESTRYLFEADELSQRALLSSLQECLESRALFADNKLILIKRLTNTEKGPAFSNSKLLLDLINRLLSRLEEQITFVLWEDKALAENHPLRKAFEEWERNGLARISVFSTPSLSRLKEVVIKFFEVEGKQITSEALNYLLEQYRRGEQRLRLQKRLKTAEALLEDERGWWLEQVLEGALLRSEEVVGLDAVRAGTEMLEAPVGSFDLLRSLERRDWVELEKQTKLFTQVSDDAAYYAFYASLAWWARQPKNNLWSRSLSELILEVELIGKNFPIEPAWLLELTLLRIRELLMGADKSHLLSPRKLWLAQLYRS